MKAVHKQPDLPCCVWPKASAAVEILDRISVLDDCYTKELTSEGQLSFNIPHDIIMKQCVLKKGTIETASAWVHVPRSCYLPGKKGRQGNGETMYFNLSGGGWSLDQVIPVTLQIRHFAPIRLVDGVTLHLDRITQTMAANDQVSYDTMSIAHVALPLSCDDHTFQTKFTTNALKIPADTPPTLDSHRYPLRITYRLRAIINLDMEGLPLRKRDRVASYVGKVMRFTEEMNANGSTIVLDVPLVVGTTEEPPNSWVKSLFDGGYGLFKEENKLITCLPETVPSMLLSPPPEYTTSPSVLVRRLSIAKADDYFDQAPPYSVAKHPSAPNLQDFPPFHFDSIPRQPSAPSLQELSDPPNEKTQRRTWSHPLQHRRTSSTTSLHNLPPPPPPHHVHEYSRESL